MYIQENALKQVVWKITVMLSRPQCINDGSYQAPYDKD